jgi:SulP family sulfate permease
MTIPTDATASVPYALPRLGSALRAAIRDGYSWITFRADITAGITVGIVALPLSMALAIASGMPPQSGIYTAIVAGVLIAALGGSRTQVTGPTAAFIAILAPVAARFGPSGLLMATAMAGVFLIAFGCARLGRLIEYIPYPVTTGFTAGIAVVVAVGQLPALFGISPDTGPHTLERLAGAIVNLPHTRWPDVAVGLVTLVILVAWPRVSHRIPAPPLALVLGTLLAITMNAMLAPDAVATIRSTFTYAVDGISRPGIPATLPAFILPWQGLGPAGTSSALSFDTVRLLLPSSLAIAVLGAMESLLSAVVADGIAGTKHDPDAELVAQGIGNMVVPFFGGFAATGAIARTAVNTRAGAKSPIAAITHSAFILVATVAVAPWLSYLPMAALAGMLLFIAWNMAEAKHALRVVKIAPRSDALVLITCFGFTIIFDMVVAVVTGVMLASLLFMRRLAEISGARIVGESHPALTRPVPVGTVVYEVAGPLFFGAAHKAMSSLHVVADETRNVILDLSGVPIIDATGLVNLQSALDRLANDARTVYLAGVQAQPRDVLKRAGLDEAAGFVEFTDTLTDALDRIEGSTDQGR